ncbi:MAG: hypothetical protein MJK10_03190 [Pseudomonadales bacterium]|nr:hypothetical protein [Pseudomonadales bacterium]NRA15073.1 hypothetical protein [Oceanospirillaceae bacterium]
MKQKVSASYIHLINSTGVVDTQAFMNFGTELWSPDAKRLTVLLDPGRIKRGVETNEALGSALLVGESYNLVIDGHWPTYEGKTLERGFVKSIVVDAPYRTLPSLEHWLVIEAVRSQLKVSLDRVFDSALLKRFVMITDNKGSPILGKIALGASEKSFTFIPNKPFESKAINIVIDPRLEDISGNNFAGLLDSTIGANKVEPVLVKRVLIFD